MAYMHTFINTHSVMHMRLVNIIQGTCSYFESAYTVADLVGGGGGGGGGQGVATPPKAQSHTYKMHY